MKSKKAPKNLAEALGVDPEQMAALLLLGHAYLENGRNREARDIFEGIQMLDPENPYAPAVLGSICQREKKYEEAIAYYDRALSLYSNDAYTLTNRGECHLNLSKFKEAALDFEASIALDPEQKHPAANRARFLAGLTLEGLHLASTKGTGAIRDAKRRIDEQLAL